VVALQAATAYWLLFRAVQAALAQLNTIAWAARSWLRVWHLSPWPAACLQPTFAAPPLNYRQQDIAATMVAYVRAQPYYMPPVEADMGWKEIRI